MSSFVRRHPLVVFFILAYAFSWAMVALISVSFLFALVALFGPAVAAVIVRGVTDGRRGIADLLRQLTVWRVGVVPYVLAVGVPLVVALVARVVHAFAFGGRIGITDGTPVPLTVVLALLVVGEEIGWRGYALPQLQSRHSGLAASLILGCAWAGWHLANATIPGLESYGSGFPAFLFFVVAQTIVFTWLWNKSGGSLLVMWILHAMINVSTGLFFVGNQVEQWWLAGSAMAIVAIIVTFADGLDLARRTARPLVASPSH